MLKSVRLLLLAACVAAGPAAVAEHKPADPSQYVSTQLIVSGAVEQPLSLRVEDLKRFPPGQIVELVRPARPDVPGEKDETLTGIRLRDLLDRIKVRKTEHNDLKKMVVIAGATDGYKAVFSWQEIYNSPLAEGMLIYFAKNGAPLGADQGQIAMVSLKDTSTGPRHVKWLRELEIKKVAQ
jgi:DMSO/TMAO reductase YedYZ molybdopterin-dependent catalytic subunit